jgi:Ca2+-binding RTX toxin-like protein
LTVNGAAALQGDDPEEGIEQILIAAGTTATFSGAQLHGNSIAINESANTGTTNLVITVASNAENDFTNLGFGGFAGGNAFDNGADTITINGAGGNETITGTGLADTINGLAGNDTLTGGADTLSGGAGNDTYSYGSGAEAAAGENIVEAAGAGNADTIRTTDDADLSALKVNGSADLEGPGADQGIEQILIAAGTTATFSGAQLHGNSIAINESANGTINLVINVASGATNTFATLGFTAFAGGNAFDVGEDTVTINGAGGNENITGTSFADFINGGAGNDTLTGGAGNNTFDFNDGDGGTSSPTSTRAPESSTGSM